MGTELFYEKLDIMLTAEFTFLLLLVVEDYCSQFIIISIFLI